MDLDNKPSKRHHRYGPRGGSVKEGEGESIACEDDRDRQEPYENGGEGQNDEMPCPKRSKAELVKRLCPERTGKGGGRRGRLVWEKDHNRLQIAGGFLPQEPRRGQDELAARTWPLRQLTIRGAKPSSPTGLERAPSLERQAGGHHGASPTS